MYSSFLCTRITLPLSEKWTLGFFSLMFWNCSVKKPPKMCCSTFISLLIKTFDNLIGTWLHGAPWSDEASLTRTLLRSFALEDCIFLHGSSTWTAKEQIPAFRWLLMRYYHQYKGRCIFSPQVRSKFYFFLFDNFQTLQNYMAMWRSQQYPSISKSTKKKVWNFPAIFRKASKGWHLRAGVISLDLGLGMTTPPEVSPTKMSTNIPASLNQFSLA